LNLILPATIAAAGTVAALGFAAASGRFRQKTAGEAAESSRPEEELDTDAIVRDTLRRAARRQKPAAVVGPVLAAASEAMAVRPRAAAEGDAFGPDRGTPDSRLRLIVAQLGELDAWAAQFPGDGELTLARVQAWGAVSRRSADADVEAFLRRYAELLRRAEVRRHAEAEKAPQRGGEPAPQAR
jgi:hypothetical protein